MRATFNVMFFVQKGKCKADGTAPILARLTLNQEKIHFSTTKSILPERWDTPNHRTLGRTQEEKAINQALDELKASIHRHFFDLQSAGETISAYKIKSLLFSTDEKKNISVEKLFDLFISDYEKLVLTQDYGKESFLDTRSARIGSCTSSRKSTRPVTFHSLISTKGSSTNSIFAPVPNGS